MDAQNAGNSGLQISKQFSVTVTKIIDEISRLNPSKYVGLYSIPVNLLKILKHILAQPLTYLFNVRKLLLPKMVAISARNTKVYRICKLCKAIFSAFYNIYRNQTLQFYSF